MLFLVFYWGWLLPLLSDIADKFNYSIPYLSAKFKTCVGKSYREYIIEQKMQEAYRLLTNTDKKIYEIVNSVGYSDVNFFTKYSINMPEFLPTFTEISIN